MTEYVPRPEPVRIGVFEVFMRGSGDDAVIAVRDHSTGAKTTEFPVPGTVIERFLHAIIRKEPSDA